MGVVRSRVLSIVGLLVLAMALAALQGPALAGSKPPKDPVPAPVPGAEASTGEFVVPGSESSDGDFTVMSSCSSFNMVGDYAHRSSTGFAVSAHGWWVNQGCSATQARVTVQLQQYYTDGTWRNKGTPGDAVVYSGGGSGNRAATRVSCSTSTTTGWRSVVDVDLIGQDDPAGKNVTPAQNVACRVP